MRQADFTKDVKRTALRRSGNLCEATGDMYGLEPNKRCSTSLAHGVEFDHIIMEANSHDGSLANCAAVCIPCHRYKTANHDIPSNAKARRIEEKRLNLRKKSSFPKRIDPWGKQGRSP